MEETKIKWNECLSFYSENKKAYSNLRTRLHEYLEHYRKYRQHTTASDEMYTRYDYAEIIVEDDLSKQNSPSS